MLLAKANIGVRARGNDGMRGGEMYLDGTSPPATVIDRTCGDAGIWSSSGFLELTIR